MHRRAPDATSRDDALVVRPAGAPARLARACPATSRSRTARSCSRCSRAGESRIAAAGDGEDVRSTAGIVAGARAPRSSGSPSAAAGSTTASCRPAATRCVEPEDVLDCGNSGTTTRLVAGLLAGPAAVRRARRRRLAPPAADGPGRPSRCARWAPSSPAGRRRRCCRSRSPAARRLRADPLRHAGAQRPGQVGDPARGASRPTARRRSPRRSRPATTPSGCSARAASPSTRATEPDGRHTVRARRARRPSPRSTRRVPADPSGAAFWLVAASIHPDAELRLDGVSTNPTRRAIIDILRRMGADIEEHDRPAPGGADGEPLADLVVRSSAAPGRRPLARRRGGGDRRDPDPAPWPPPWRPGTTRFRGAGELRHKESDRIAGIAAGLDGPRRDGCAWRATTSRSTAARAADGRRHRDPRRSPARDDVRDRRPHRRGRDDRQPARVGGRSPTPASSANSKGCGHDEARRPHRPPGGAFAVRRDAAGGLRPRSASTRTYELWDRAPIALADAIAELRTDDFLGANVTIPHKERVVPAWSTA